MFASILSAIAAIPAILGFLKELASFLKDTFGDNAGKFLVDSAEAFKQLKVAKSPEEKIEAAKKIQDLIDRL